MQQIAVAEMSSFRFANMLVCCWAARTGAKSFPRRQDVERALIEMHASMPAAEPPPMTLDTSWTGDSIAEYETWIWHAMSAGLVSRLGRDRYVVEVMDGTARDILISLAKGRRDWQAWFDKVVDLLVERADPAFLASSTRRFDTVR